MSWLSVGRSSAVAVRAHTQLVHPVACTPHIFTSFRTQHRTQQHNQHRHHTTAASTNTSTSTNTPTPARQAQTDTDTGLEFDHTSTATTTPLLTNPTDEFARLCAKIAESAEAPSKRHAAIQRLTKLFVVTPSPKANGPDPTTELALQRAIMVVHKRTEIGATESQKILNVVAARVVVPHVTVSLFKHHQTTLVNFAKALVVAKHKQARFLALAISSIVNEHPDLLQRSTTDDLVDMVWVLGRTFVRDSASLSRLYHMLVQDVGSLTPFHVCMLLWALARLHVNDLHKFDSLAVHISEPEHAEHHVKPIIDSEESVVQALATHATTHLAQYEPRDLAHLSWALARLQFHSPDVFDKIAAHALPRVSEFNAQMVTNLAWAFGKVGHSHEQLFQTLCHTIPPNIPVVSCQGVSNLLWAFARVGMVCPGLLSAVSTHRDRFIPRMSAQGLANVAWAYAALGVRDVVVFRSIAAAALASLDHFRPQTFSVIAWSFTRMGIPSADLFDRIAAVSTPMLSSFTMQGLANLLWGMAKQTETSDEGDISFDELASGDVQDFDRDMQHAELDSASESIAVRAGLFQEAARLILAMPHPHKSVPPICISAILCSFARMRNNEGFHSLVPELEQVVLVLCQSVIARVDEFDTQALSNISWAIGKFNPSELHEPFEAVLATVFDATLQKFTLVNDINICSLMWAMGKFSVAHKPLMQAICGRVLSCSDDMSPRALSTITWAFARLHQGSPEELHTAIAAHATRNVQVYPPQSLTLIVWSLAILSIDNAAVTASFVDALQRTFRENPSQFKDRDACLCAWSLVVLGFVDSELVRSVVARDWVHNPACGPTWNEEGYAQLYQCHLALTLNGLPGLDSGSLEVCRFHIERATKPTHSQPHSWFQKNVVSALQELRIPYRHEVLTPECISIDVLVSGKNGERIAIEVDGEQHFCVGRKTPLGTTNFKRVLLERLGYHVVNISQHTWQATDDDGKKKMLNNLLGPFL